jgi:hypothetical protein
MTVVGRTDCALLCDAVPVRDGLLHILGSGVGRVRRSQYRSLMGNDLALRFALAPDEAHGAHQLEIRVVDIADMTTSSLTGAFMMGHPDGPQVESEAFSHLPVSLRQVVVRALRDRDPRRRPAPGTRLRLEVAVVTQEA